MEYVYNRQNFQTCKASLCYIFGSLSGQFVHFLVFFSSSPKSFQKKKKAFPTFFNHGLPDSYGSCDPKLLLLCCSLLITVPIFFNLSDLIHNWKEHTDLSSVQV